MRLFLLFFLSAFTFLSCSKEPVQGEPIDFDNNIDAVFDYYTWLIGESQDYYDNGSGHFGQTIFGYRNVLNECYLRFDGYQLMRNAEFEYALWLKHVYADILKYYTQVADTIGTGVWGFPAEINHPEFGEEFAYEMNAGRVNNAWIYELSGDIGSEAGIYYVHGQVLSDISKVYLRDSALDLLQYIEDGAAWICEKNYKRGNVNYFAAALKGLSYAYAATQDETIKTQALVYLEAILKEQNRDGSFGGEHDQEAGYHGITLSCLAVARKYLPETNVTEKLDQALQLAMMYLKGLKDIAVEDRAAFVVQAWYYLSCLADDGFLTEFTTADWECYSNAIGICIDKKQELVSYKDNNNYFYQKGIQSFSLLGSTVSKFYFHISNEFY